MHIGIDGGCWNNRRGYGRFLREVLAAVARHDQRNRYTIFLDSPSAYPLPAGFREVVVATSQATATSATAASRRSVGDLLRMSWAVRRERPDLFFFPSVYSYFPLLSPTPMILGIHDTIADRNPQFAFASRQQEIFWRWKVKLGIAQSRTILTVSEYSKHCLEDWFGIPAGRIRIVYEAASPHFRPLQTVPAEHPFLLYVGGISPNKNLDTLIRAFARMRARQRGLRLYLVGDYQSDGFKSCYGDLTALVRELRVDGAVQFLGFVPDEELCVLYNQAQLFVLPSLDEGFGLPVVEAMACGTPVVVNGGNAMEEVAADAGVVVDARQEEALAAAMDDILAQPARREELAQRALHRARDFSWDAAARSLIHVFEEARN
jgi:glycosyltransferase involved in cell wall biosynthesis